MNITCIHTYYKSVNLINIKLLIAINVFETRVARLLPFEVALYGYKKLTLTVILILILILILIPTLILFQFDDMNCGTYSESRPESNTF